METLQAKIDCLETELAEINENETFTQDLIDRKNQVTNDLSEARHTLGLQQQEQKAREQKQEQKHEELQELVRGHNFNEVLGHPDANKLFHMVLYEESIKYEDAIAGLEKEITRLNDSLIAAQEREVNLQHQNDNLQKSNEDQQDLKTKYEEAQNDARHYLNESNRYQAKVRELEDKLDQAEKQKAEWKPSGSLADMVASAKAETEKRKLMNIRQVDRATYVGINEKGEEEKVNWLELPNIEQVSQFRPADEVSENPVESNDVQDVSQFHEAGGQQQDHGLSVDRDGAVQKDDGQTVTREEFTALQGRVAALETSKGMVA